MKDQPPSKIFLQFYGMDADDMNAEYGDEWCEAYEITYSTDQHYDTDVEYVLPLSVELAETGSLVGRDDYVLELEAENAALREQLGIDTRRPTHHR